MKYLITVQVEIEFKNVESDDERQELSREFLIENLSNEELSIKIEPVK